MRSERGQALLWAMLLVFFVGSLSAILIQRGRTVTGGGEADRIRLASFHAAEGGLAHVRVALAADPAFTGDRIEVGSCRVTSTVERLDEGWSVEVVASPGGARVRARLVPGEGHPEVRDWRRVR